MFDELGASHSVQHPLRIRLVDAHERRASHELIVREVVHLSVDKHATTRDWHKLGRIHDRMLDGLDVLYALRCSVRIGAILVLRTFCRGSDATHQVVLEINEAWFPCLRRLVIPAHHPILYDASVAVLETVDVHNVHERRCAHPSLLL